MYLISEPNIDMVWEKQMFRINIFKKFEYLILSEIKTLKKIERIKRTKKY